jgi:hypothetical protein
MTLYCGHKTSLITDHVNWESFLAYESNEFRLPYKTNRDSSYTLTALAADNLHH